MAASIAIAPYARAAGHLRFVRLLGLSVFIEYLALIGLVVFLRRRLASQIDRAAAHQSFLAEQNERLVDQNAELEEQADTMQHQAVELESQAALLVEHAQRLTDANQVLAEGVRRQQALADQALLLGRRLAEAQGVANLGYWEIDSTSGEVFWSDEMYRLAGLEVGIKPPPTERFLAAVHPDDRQRMQDVARAALRDLSEFTEQYRITLPNLPVKTVQSKGRVIVDERGHRKLVGTVQDVTDRVHLEAQLRRSQKMEAIGQLAGGVAHDFNNVLTVVEGYTGLLLSSQSIGDDDRTFIDEIRHAARRAGALTRQLLAFSRQQVLQPQLVDVNEAIADVEKMLRRLIGEHIEFQTNLSPSIDLVKADPGQLEQVLMNLVVNARDAMDAGGTLTIETTTVVIDAAYTTGDAPNSCAGRYVMLAVSDTGTGISPHDLEHIFEPFFTTKESGKGTGLGLSTVHGIVEQSGGHMSVHSEVARGTTFKIYLPCAEVNADAIAAASVRVASRAGSETILLVEDDRAVRTVATAALQRGGYRVIEADNGVSALRIVEAGDAAFDLVLSDMVMPGMGGRELAGHLQRLLPDVPVVLMSGYTRDAMLHSAQLPAGSPFLEKPFTPDGLTQKIRETLDRAGTI